MFTSCVILAGMILADWTEVLVWEQTALPPVTSLKHLKSASSDWLVEAICYFLNIIGTRHI